MGKVRISELPALTTGSAETELVGNYRGKTYRISLSEITASIIQLLSESVDSRLDLLENFENNFNELSESFSSRIEIATNETIFATTGSNTFIGNQTISGSVGISANTGSWNFRTDGTLVLPNNTGIYGNGLLQIDTIGGFLLTSYTDQFGSGSQEWYFHSDGTLNAPGNIYGASNLATTGSNTFSGSQTISGSLIPAVGDGETTSSFSLGAPDAAWKDIWVSKGTIHFLDDTGSIVDTISAISGGIAVSNLIVSGSMTGSLDYIHLINSPEFPTTGSNTFYGNQKSYGTVAANAMMNPQDLIEPTIIPSGYNGLLIGPVGTNTEIIVQDNALLVIL